MKQKNKLNSFENIMTILYFALYLVIGMSLLIKQPFGNPPDEYNRYLIPLYIAENGTLPNGYDASIRIGGYGFSYGFQPILPYMFQGYAMMFVKLFTNSDAALLYAARSVNLFFGLCMAWVVLLLSKKWFHDPRFGWCFAFLVMFLPQSIFVHTYVNTDSCCLLSIAIMLYGLTLGTEHSFAFPSCMILSIGIILCALSYYNAYGYILSCILLFTAFFLSVSHGHIHFNTGAFLQKGCLISALVLSGIGWWFIRSAILYDGDFLGLYARNQCASLYAIPEYHPDTRITWQNQNYSLWEMITNSDFCTLSLMSFIGVYGPMTITTSIWVYRFYKGLFLLGLVFCILIPLSKTSEVRGLYYERKKFGLFFHINMLFCILMPLFLSIIYSYATDYQPQGRYLLPALIPLCYYTLHGMEKAWNLPTVTFACKERFLTWLSVLFCLVIAGMLMLTVFGYAFPYYEANPIAP